jgi:hypothetical protein
MTPFNKFETAISTPPPQVVGEFKQSLSAQNTEKEVDSLGF